MVRSQQPPARNFTIAKLAKAAGVGVETIRYYQREGLLEEPPAGPGAYRLYDSSHLERLRFIRRAKLAGFALREIAELVRLDRTHERGRVRELASGKLDALARQIEELRETHAALRHLVHLCENEKAEADCPIIESLGGDTGRHQH